MLCHMLNIVRMVGQFTYPLPPQQGGIQPHPHPDDNYIGFWGTNILMVQYLGRFHVDDCLLAMAIRLSCSWDLKLCGSLEPGFQSSTCAIPMGPLPCNVRPRNYQEWPGEYAKFLFWER